MCDLIRLFCCVRKHFPPPDKYSPACSTRACSEQKTTVIFCCGKGPDGCKWAEEMGSLPSFPSGCDIMHSAENHLKSGESARCSSLHSIFRVSVFAGGRADKNIIGMKRHFTHEC